MTVRSFLKNPYIGFTIDFVFALGYCVIGIITPSWWLITVGTYYVVLASAQYYLIRVRRKTNGDYGIELSAKRITGILLVILSFCIVGINILSAVKDRGTDFHEVVMITIAAYTFAKITLSIIGMASSNLSRSPISKASRNISLADACVSVYAMQRSMLVSFPGMKTQEILILNISTGTAVWIAVLILGINLIGGKRNGKIKNR